MSENDNVYSKPFDEQGRRRNFTLDVMEMTVIITLIVFYNFFIIFMITVMIIMMNARWEASQCQWENGAILSASRWEPPLSLGFIIRMSIVKLVMMRMIDEVAELISQY